MSNHRDHEARAEGRDTPRRQGLVQELADALYEHEHRQQAGDRQSPEYLECREEAERRTPLEVAPYRDADLIDRGYIMKKEYPYTDLNGTQLYFKRRYEHQHIEGDKRFRQGRRDGNSPTGVAASPGFVKVPYRWPELAAADATKPVYWCEGEKDVDTCIAKGLIATTAADQIAMVIVNAMKGRHVVVLVDNDASGEKKAAKAVEAFRHDAESLRVVRIPGLKYRQDVTDWFEHHGGDVDKLKEIVDSEPCVIEEARRGAIRALPFRLYADADIPWPDFIYGTGYIRGVLSITASAGGLGKSAVVMTEALAMATGKALIHGIAPESPQNVWYINLEDGDNVLVPRFMALARFHNITSEDIGDRLIIDNNNMTLVLASEDERRRASLNPVAVTEIIRTIKAKGIDVVIIDPLVSAHKIPENDNNGIDVVAKALARIARETNCALMVVHHMTKGKEERTSDNVRGASALVNAARAVRVLNHMTTEDAKKVGGSEEKRGLFFSMDDGKTNLAPAGKRVWFERFNYDQFSFDDRRREVVLVKAFVPAAPGAGDRVLTEDDFRAAFGQGGPWRVHQLSPMWAGHTLAASLGLGAECPADKKAAMVAAINNAVRRGWLVRDEERDGNSVLRPVVRFNRSPPVSATDGEDGSAGA